jgi:hypothetical protein
MTNPWKLTPAEVRALESYIDTGSIARAAVKQGQSSDTLHEHFANIHFKMRTNREPRPTSPRCAILYDRWKQKQS